MSAQLPGFFSPGLIRLRAYETKKQRDPQCIAFYGDDRYRSKETQLKLSFALGDSLPLVVF